MGKSTLALDPSLFSVEIRPFPSRLKQKFDHVLESS